jgi:hypothetical protein
MTVTDMTFAHEKSFAEIFFKPIGYLALNDI